MKKIVVTIDVDAEADEQTVRASIEGLAETAALAVTERANAEAMKLLETRARLRRFRRPVIVRSFDSSGNLIMKHGESDWTWGDDSTETGEPGSIVLEDARGRKASVRVEITA